MGCRACSLGIRSMPDGYTLMQNRDGYYFWLENATGRESVIHWDNWAIYRGAHARAGATAGGAA